MFSRHTMSSCEFQMLFSLENRKVRNCSGRNRNVLMMQRSRVLWLSFTRISRSVPADIQHRPTRAALQHTSYLSQGTPVTTAWALPPTH